MQIAGQAWANVCLLLLPSSSSLFRIYFGQNGTHFIWRTTLFLHWAWKYTEINLKVEFWSFRVMKEFELVWRREYKERGVNGRKCKQQALIWAVWAIGRFCIFAKIEFTLSEGPLYFYWAWKYTEIYLKEEFWPLRAMEVLRVILDERI